MALDLKEVREQLLSELAALRGELDSLEAHLEPALEKGTVPGLTSELERVFLSVRRHALNELHLLEPVIRDLDAWGEARAADMDNEREEWRQLVAHFTQLDPASDPERWVVEVKKLIARFREELDGEEKGRLSREVLLRDGTITVDFGG